MHEMYSTSLATSCFVVVHIWLYLCCMTMYSAVCVCSFKLVGQRLTKPSLFLICDSTEQRFL